MPATVWTDVSIFNDEYLSEAKLDAMQGNADYVRDDHRVLLVGGAPGIAGGREYNIGPHNEFSSIRLRIDVGAQTSTYAGPLRSFATSTDAWRDFAMLNVPWTSPSAGSAADIIVSAEFAVLENTPPWVSVGELFRVPGVLRRRDFNYLSLWVSVNPLRWTRAFFGTDPQWCWIRQRDLTILGSRENEGFAP